jgi:hypothetical protein
MCMHGTEKQGKVWLVHACGTDRGRLLAANGLWRSGHSCLKLTAPNSDTLTGVEDGSHGMAQDADNFAADADTFTFTRGTGRFDGASGSAGFSVVFSRIGGTASPVQGIAFYSFAGTLSLQHDDR